jgi:hypothetical protein
MVNRNADPFSSPQAPPVWSLALPYWASTGGPAPRQPWGAGRVVAAVSGIALAAAASPLALLRGLRASAGAPSTGEAQPQAQDLPREHAQQPGRAREGERPDR